MLNSHSFHQKSANLPKKIIEESFFNSQNNDRVPIFYGSAGTSNHHGLTTLSLKMFYCLIFGKAMYIVHYRTVSWPPYLLRSSPCSPGSRRKVTSLWYPFGHPNSHVNSCAQQMLQVIKNLEPRIVHDNVNILFSPFGHLKNKFRSSCPPPFISV